MLSVIYELVMTVYI